MLAPDELAGWIVDRASSTARYIVGIAGPPGSGKSTLAVQLAGELAAPVVGMDGFHRSNAELIDLGLIGVKGAPETFDAESFVELVRRLRSRTEVIRCPTFDRSIDEPVADQVVVAPDDRVVIVEGNYLLLDEPPWDELARLLDAVAYIDVPDDLRFERLVDRHVAFGRDRADAVDFAHRSDEANARRVLPGRDRADIVVSAYR